MKTTLVSKCMSQPVISISSHAKVSEAHHLMLEKRIRRLPVVDDGQLVGIVSLLDVSEARPPNADKLRPTALHTYIGLMKVDEVMTRHPVTTTPNASVIDVARQMARHKISGLPVVDDGKVVGIITESDVFRAIVALYDDENRAAA